MRRVIFKSVIEQLGAMRLIISGGAPLDMQTARNFRELGIELVQGYGLTETSPVIAAESWEFMRENSVGKPLKSVEVRIDNKDENGIGEIMVKGPNIMLGYYENDDATNAVMKDGWFATSDLGYLDKDGYLFITGREKNMIVLKNGKKVFPEELETLINRIEGVKESFVYGIDEDGLGCEKVLCKVVYDAEEVSGSFDEIYEKYWNKIKEINKTLPMYKYIKGMILTDEPLIKTTTNKVRRKEEMAVILSDKK
jgi:long-chain acyl-CoA synthetase